MPDIRPGELFLQVTLAPDRNRLCLKYQRAEGRQTFVSLAWMENAISRFNIDYHGIGFPGGVFRTWWVDRAEGVVNFFVPASDDMLFYFMRCRSEKDEGEIINLTINDWLREVESLSGLDSREKERIQLTALLL